MYNVYMLRPFRLCCSKGGLKINVFAPVRCRNSVFKLGCEVASRFTLDEQFATCVRMCATVKFYFNASRLEITANHQIIEFIRHQLTISCLGAIYYNRMIAVEKLRHFDKLCSVYFLSQKYEYFREKFPAELYF